MHIERQQVGALTGLRFVAAAHVFLFHYGASTAERVGAPGPLVTFLQNGYFGVSLFFILSGFILTYTYRREVGNVGRYALARFARIYPVYLFALLLALPLVVGKLEMDSAAKVLLMLQSWTVPESRDGMAWIMQAWTLSVELAFYIAFPLLLRVIGRWSVGTLHVAGLVAAAVIVAIGSPGFAPATVRLDVPGWIQQIGLPLLRMPEFVLGMVVCRIFLTAPRPAERHGEALTLLAAGAVLLLLMLPSPRALGIASVATAGLIYCLACFPSTRLSRLLSARAMLLLGGASYALYLLQWPVREWLRVITPSGLDQVLNPLAAVGLSIAVFLWLERPMRQWIVGARSRLSPA